jgi:hypothetical protein
MRNARPATAAGASIDVTSDLFRVTGFFLISPQEEFVAALRLEDES